MKTTYQYLLASVLFFNFFSQAEAQVKVNDPWVRATVPQQKATGAFMQIESPQDTRLVEVRSPVAAVVELHQMEMTDNVMKMRSINGIDISAGKKLELKPGSYHVMLIDLKGQIKEGDIIPITLVLESKGKNRESVEVKAVARPLNQPSAASSMQHH